MRAGMLNREITIMVKSKAVDADYGTEIVTWVPLAPDAGSPSVGERFRANVQDVMPSRSESVAQGLVVGRLQTRIRIRWRDDVSSDMRILLHTDGADEVFDIVAGPSEIDGKKSLIEFMCERFSS